MHAVRLIAVFVVALMSWPAVAETISISNVTIIDVETGLERHHQNVFIRGGRIAKIGPAEKLTPPRGTTIVDGAGKYLIPGLWDMHVHSHREERWKYHYPLFRAYGVTGVRDSGSHLGSALAAMKRAQDNSLAPRVVWGSPIIDGAPPFNSFGLSAEDEDAARELTRELKRLGFDFIKVYDRLTPGAYYGLADEARRQGMRVEGHVPLSLSPLETTKAGQTTIDHLTLVLEACLPGALDIAHTEFAAAPADVDSLALLMDDRMAAVLGQYDVGSCGALFDMFAANGVWQVPTLVEMRGFFYAKDIGTANDTRAVLTTPTLLAEWREWGETSDPHELANGQKVLAAQMRMIPAMRDHGVGILVGTDASSEPWVFAGAGVHDEMGLLVEAGLSPLEALQAATINPLRYLGRKSDAPVISNGEVADLVLLEADPRLDIANTLRIAGVVARGRYYDRTALDALVGAAEREAKTGKR